MNKPSVNIPNRKINIPECASDIMNVLWHKHEEIFDEWKNKQLKR